MKMFEQFLNKWVRIVQADEFVKYGLFEKEESGIITLLLNDSRRELIRTDFIMLMSPSERRDEVRR